MGKKKLPKVAVIFDEAERHDSILARMRANKTRKAEGKKRNELKV